MENLLIYFAKVNGLIILFYLMYVLFLRKETFFVSNRFYFIIGLLLSLVLPLITFTKTIWVEPAPVAEFYQETTSVNSDLIAIPIQENPIDWTIILLSSYVIISIAIILKIGVELASFFKRIQKQNKQKGSDYTLIDSNSIENPFSFFSYIIINKNMFTEEEIEHILTHESVHVKQKHSIDVLFGKLFCALFWVNPIIWLYRKAMLQNLEFIADNETFQQIENKYEYQKTLLKVVTHQHNLSITNQFYQSLIKKRIVMLHTNQSHKKNAWKYATILPLLVGFMLLFQIETVAQVKEKSEIVSYAVSSNFSSILTKNTTDKELRELEKTFSDEKYKLKISKVKRNKKGEIIGIKLSFDSGKTYNRILERKSTEPIDDIKIFINSDKDDDTTCGFEEIKNTVGVNWNDAESFSTVEIKKSATDETIYIINGKEYTKEEMKDKIAELDGAIEVNEDEKSGKKIMLFKGKSNISDEPKTTISFDEIAKKKESEKPNSEAVYAVLVEAEYSEDETISNIDKIKREKLVDAKKALIFFNGKEINYEDLDKIDPKTISSFGNTIASHAIKKYGEKGKNGVIFINTKAYDIENNPFMKEYENKKQIELKAQENSSNSKEVIEERKKKLEERKIKLEQIKEERNNKIEQKKE
jgi:beta-lactamase regulating signal transducer with metallopeptidase domain